MYLLEFPIILAGVVIGEYFFSGTCSQFVWSHHNFLIKKSIDITSYLISYIAFLLETPAQYAPTATVHTASSHKIARLPSMLAVRGAYICTLTSLPKSCTNKFIDIRETQSLMLQCMLVINIHFSNYVHSVHILHDFLRLNFVNFLQKKKEKKTEQSLFSVFFFWGMTQLENVWP